MRSTVAAVPLALTTTLSPGPHDAGHDGAGVPAEVVGAHDVLHGKPERRRAPVVPRVAGATS